MSRPGIDRYAALGVYLALAAVTLARDGFSIPWHYWQLLPVDALRDAPAAALLDHQA